MPIRSTNRSSHGSPDSRINACIAHVCVDVWRCSVSCRCPRAWLLKCATASEAWRRVNVPSDARCSVQCRRNNQRKNSKPVDSSTIAAGHSWSSNVPAINQSHQSINQSTAGRGERARVLKRATTVRTSTIEPPLSPARTCTTARSPHRQVGV